MPLRRSTEATPTAGAGEEPESTAPGEQGADLQTPGPSSEHPERLRQFAFFRLSSEAYISDPYERGRIAWGQTLESLAKLAEPEDWVGTDSDVARPLPILDSYLRYTYARLHLEGKICVAEEGEYAAFNTGLLTPHAEDVFALFARNRNENAQPWVFLRWAPESDRLIMQQFPEPPEMAEYVHTAADLVYDWPRPLKLAYEHILVDNIERFPPDLRQTTMRARQALDLAVAWALKRVRRNYKTVVPQWYPRLGAAGAQFLMPLDLSGDHDVDLALVVSAVGESAYRGHTVLTLDMAYTNARLVARPDSDWLVPRATAIPAVDEAFDLEADAPG